MKDNALKWIVMTGTALCIYMALHLHAGDSPKVGSRAPLVSGKNQNGKVWSLEKALKKGAVLLYFYPKDDTPGCTKQACGLRDRIGELKKDGIQVVGVSRDTEASHLAFISKFSLNFDLLSDVDGKITSAYGAEFPGKDTLSRRISFLIRQDGTIAHVTDTMKAETHLEEMKDAAAKLK